MSAPYVDLRLCSVHWFYTVNAEHYSVYFEAVVPKDGKEWLCIIYKGTNEIWRGYSDESSRVKAGYFLAMNKII